MERRRLKRASSSRDRRDWRRRQRGPREFEWAYGLGHRTPRELEAALAGLAIKMERIRLGTLVSPVTFRPPGNLAVRAATVERMSGGRIDVGLGAGWDPGERARYGFAFPPIAARLSLLEDYARSVHEVWVKHGDWSRSVQGGGLHRAGTGGRGTRPRLIIGDRGGPRSLSLAAAQFDEYNLLERCQGAPATSMHISMRSALLWGGIPATSGEQRWSACCSVGHGGPTRGAVDRWCTWWEELPEPRRGSRSDANSGCTSRARIFSM